MRCMTPRTARSPVRRPADLSPAGGPHNRIHASSVQCQSKTSSIVILVDDHGLPGLVLAARFCFAIMAGEGHDLYT